MNPLRYIVTLSIALVVAGLMIPLGLQSIATSNMTGVNASVATVFTILLPILAIIGTALAFMPPEIKSKLNLQD